ncbi:hypothetical protein [Nocardioides alkalitolerans]|uniref:hypothetical protein n=1 Tax=Nocardioides alkalitolerans TaxID=281714 RepID=UPI0004167AFB|nr:hypothetical protein [Nocardioides alkalitolerans]
MEDRAAYLRERRALVRTHHPDVGGDPAELQRRLALLDARYGVGPAPAAEQQQFTVVPTGPVGRLRRRARRARRAVRARIPRGVPGSRRYVRVDRAGGEDRSDRS